MLQFISMKINKRLSVFLIIGLIIMLAAIVWQVMGGKSLKGEKWTGVAGEPVSITLDFYEAWLQARAVDSSDAFSIDLLQFEQLGPVVRERANEFKDKIGEEGLMDPILCQTELPEGLRTLPVYIQDETAQILVMSTTKGHSGQAIVNMVAKNNLWQITDINCGNAETAPQGEFSFDKTGFLLKQVPAPLDSNYWHLVFEEAGVLGHAVPLFMNEETECIMKDGTITTCSDDVLKETIPARVYGEMSETGVQVKKIELVETVSIN